MDGELNFEKGVIVDKEIENAIKASSGESAPPNPTGYRSPLEALMGTNKDAEETTSDGQPEYNIKLIESVVAKIVKLSSVFKVEVFNLDNEDARKNYSRLQNKPNIKIVEEVGSWCTYESSSKDERTKDMYYKVVVKYREVDYDKFIEGFEKACRSNIMAHEIAIGMMIRAFYELEARSEELMERLTKASDEGLKQLREERRKRKEILAKKSEEQKKEREKREADERRVDSPKDEEVSNGNQ